MQLVELKVSRDHVSLFHQSPPLHEDLPIPRLLAAMDRDAFRAWLTMSRPAPWQVQGVMWFVRPGGILCLELLAADGIREPEPTARNARGLASRGIGAVDALPAPLVRQLLEVI